MMFESTIAEEELFEILEASVFRRSCFLWPSGDCTSPDAKRRFWTVSSVASSPRGSGFRIPASGTGRVSEVWGFLRGLLCFSS